MNNMIKYHVQYMHIMNLLCMQLMAAHMGSHKLKGLHSSCKETLAGLGQNMKRKEMGL